MAKITSKQTEIDIASSEREDLVKKAQSVKASLEEARGELEQLEADQRTKVTHPILPLSYGLIVQ